MKTSFHRVQQVFEREPYLENGVFRVDVQAVLEDVVPLDALAAVGLNYFHFFPVELVPEPFEVPFASQRIALLAHVVADRFTHVPAVHVHLIGPQVDVLVGEGSHDVVEESLEDRVSEIVTGVQLAARWLNAGVLPRLVGATDGDFAFAVIARQLIPALVRVSWGVKFGNDANTPFLAVRHDLLYIFHRVGGILSVPTVRVQFRPRRAFKRKGLAVDQVPV